MTVFCRVRNRSYRCCSGGRRTTDVFRFRPASQLLRGFVTITPARTAARLVQTMLVRTDCDACVWLSPMNLCPCGYHGDPRRACTCAVGVLVASRSGSQLGARQSRFTGGLLVSGCWRERADSHHWFEGAATSHLETSGHCSRGNWRRNWSSVISHAWPLCPHNWI